jgi:hypothetical protein
MNKVSGAGGPIRVPTLLGWIGAAAGVGVLVLLALLAGPGRLRVVPFAPVGGGGARGASLPTEAVPAPAPDGAGAKARDAASAPGTSGLAGNLAAAVGVAPSGQQGAQAQPGAQQNAQPGAPAQQGVAPLPPLPAGDRMIVKSGSLVLQVTDLADGMRRVGGVVAGIPGAYVAASSTSYRGDPAPPVPQPVSIDPQRLPGGQSASLTLKVPAGDFDAAMERLRALGTPVQEQVSTQEVTEEYVDLDAQVRSLEAVEAQYLRLLEKAQRVEEILPLQQRVTEVRTQIDRLRGRMNLLQRRADLSTITVSLTLPGRPGDPFAGPEPRPLRTLRLAVSGLGGALVGLLDAAIYLTVYLLPVLLVGGAIYWWRRSRRHGPPASDTAAPATAGG